MAKTPDLGAFEFTVSFGDLNDDTIINLQDIVLIVGLVLNDGYSLPADLNILMELNLMF